MEVSVVSTSGFPEHALLSIRAGAVKRQAPAASDKPLRFARGETKELLKFDILQCVGTGYVVLKPFEDRYKVVLTGKGDQNEMACEVDIKHVDGSRPAEKQRDEEKHPPTTWVQDANSYLEGHGVLQFMHGLIQALVKERPTDPYKFMGRHISNGYDAGSAPKPPCGKASERGIHHQAHETVMKLLKPEGASALRKAFGTPLDGAKPDALPDSPAKCAPPAAAEAKPDAPPDSPAKCAPPAAAEAEEKCAPPAAAPPANDVAPHTDMVGDLCKKEAASRDQKALSGIREPVEDFRQKAKGLFIESCQNGSLAVVLKEQSASAPAAGGEVSKEPAEAAEAAAGDDGAAAGNANAPLDQDVRQTGCQHGSLAVVLKEVRQKAKGIFIERYQNGSLAVVLKEQSASAPAAGGKVSKPTEAAEAAAGNASAPLDQDSRKEETSAEEAKGGNQKEKPELIKRNSMMDKW